MRKAIAQSILKLMGWKLEFDGIPKQQSYVCLGAPHTSNYDGLITMLGTMATDIPFRFIAKKELFEGWKGGFFRRLGGIPIDRKSPGGLIEKMANLFKEHEGLILVMSPEGTRTYTEYWKSGFYRVALKAGVPVGLGFMDYKTKVFGIHDELIPITGDVKGDMEKIRAFYSKTSPAKIENFGPVRLKEEETGFTDEPG